MNHTETPNDTKLISYIVDFTVELVQYLRKESAMVARVKVPNVLYDINLVR